MLFKKACVLGAVVLAGAAIAQMFVEGAHGRGLVRNAEGQGGAFRFEVAKFAHEGKTHLRGNWTFTNHSPTAVNRFEISLVHLGELNVEGHVAMFAGRARLTRMTPNGPIRINGHLGCRVEDRKRPNMPGDPDKYQFRFIAEGGEPTIEFAGLVTTGDLAVRDQQVDN